MSQNAIEIEGLRKVYGSQKGQPVKEALKGIDLKIPLGIRRGPSSVALADGMVVVGFNEVSVVLRVPAGEN